MTIALTVSFKLVSF